MAVSSEAAALESPRARSERRAGYALVALVALAFLTALPKIWHTAMGPPPPGAGTPAPVFTAATPAGEALRLEDFRGKVTLVDFWATWCPPCVASMPHLQAVQDELGPRGFAVLGVNQEPGQDRKVAAFMKARGLSFPTVIDTAGISGAWGVFTYPTSFLLDREGVIRQVYRGPPLGRSLRQDVEALLGAAPPPKTGEGASS